MAHEEYEADPWHVWSFDVGGDEICSNGVDEDDYKTAPEIEESDEVEDRNARKSCQNESATGNARLDHSRDVE
jgi:hypothetical protein